jgi:hypothetical protein
MTHAEITSNKVIFIVSLVFLLEGNKVSRELSCISISDPSLWVYIPSSMGLHPHVTYYGYPKKLTMDGDQ